MRGRRDALHERELLIKAGHLCRLNDAQIASALGISESRVNQILRPFKIKVKRFSEQNEGKALTPLDLLKD